MNKNIQLLLTLSLALSVIKTSYSVNPKPVDNYPNEVVLQGPDLYYLYWKHDNTDITFEVHYKNTTKWFLFGFDSMTSIYSDVVVGWLNDDKETGHFSDRKLINQNNQLSVDESQDWLVVDAFASDDYRVVKFTRKIKLLCDGASSNSDDLDIQPGLANRIIYSFGPNANSNDGTIELKNVMRSSNIVLLKQSNGPFNCAPIPKKPIFTSNPTSYYSNYVDLVEGIYRFYWNFTSTDLTGEIHVKTNGWVGFGLSPTGGMDQSDVVIGWINDDGSTNFTDRFIYNKEVRIDKNQNWKLLKSAKTNGYVIFKFTRPIVLCDSDDRKIDFGSPNVIFAFGDKNPPPGQDISYHGAANRASKTVNIISGPLVKQDQIPNLEIIEFSVSNVIVPKNLDTYYYCNIFKIPTNLTEKRHILKWELVLPKINNQNIHHMVIYECVDGYDGTPKFVPGNCLTNEVKNKFCGTITHTWSFGGDAISYFPTDTGYPIGGDTGYKYVVPEIHYDNPEYKIGYIESVKVRFYMTKQLQKNELGSLTVGTDMSPLSIFLPQKIPKIGINAYCSNECISKHLATTNITIISSIPHTHLVGKEIWTKIIRNGEDIGYLFRNKNYDFNYQQNFLLNPPVNVTKNDQLVTYCGYSTTGRKSLTNVGHSTKEEMCFQFFTYYPRSANLKWCTSSPDFREAASLLQSLNDTREISIPPFDKNSYESTTIAMYEYFNRSDIQDFSDNIKNKFIKMYNYSKTVTSCNNIMNYDNPIYPPLPKNVYVEKDVCSKNIDSSTNSGGSSNNEDNKGKENGATSLKLFKVEALLVTLAYLFLMRY